MIFLKNKLAVVTGAASGIGYQIAVMLSDLGASVAICDVNKEKLFDAVNRINKRQKTPVSGFVIDVTNVNSIEKGMKEIKETLGGIDILVNSAGILGTMSIEEMDKEKEWDKVLDVNLSGTFFMSQYALSYLKESLCPRIINIASVSGRNGGFEASMSYVASKGGVIAITKGMARHLAKYNITVNAISPGATETDMVSGYSDAQLENQVKNILLHRLGKPQEIAAVACFLASDEAAFITGANIDVNGGAYFA